MLALLLVALSWVGHSRDAAQPSIEPRASPQVTDQKRPEPWRSVKPSAQAGKTLAGLSARKCH
jgi:hypothetical protein